ncbi:reduced growth phenotype protein 1 [Tanacetum coccineum]
MPPPPRSLSSLFGISKPKNNDPDPDGVSMKLESDKKVYRPGDPVTITIQIRNQSSSILLVEKLSFEAKGVEKLDTQWFSSTKKNNHHNKTGEYVFMESSVPSVVTNQILSSGATTTYILRINLPTIIPPSYRGSTVRYLYHVKTELSGKYITTDDGLPPGGSTQKFSDIVRCYTVYCVPGVPLS